MEKSAATVGIVSGREMKTLYTICHCEVSGMYLSYASVMVGWCRHWSNEKDRNNE